MSGYISIDGLYWEMKSVMKNNFNRERLTLNQRFKRMKKALMEDLGDIIEQNKEDLIKELSEVENE